MSALSFSLISAILLCTLVAGLVFTFAVVVMPGIRRLDNRGYIRAFQVMDAIIQESQPLFVIVWLGSIVTTLVAVVLGFLELSGPPLYLLVSAGALYLFTVQLPTMIVNVPLNNALQALDTSSMDEASLRTAREAFEPRWIRWNTVRTVTATVTSVLLLLVLVGLP